MLPDWLTVDLRPVPAANVVLVAADDGRPPVLFDSGTGTAPGIARTERFLRDNGVAPAELGAVVCTHFHADHVGGCAWLQAEHGVPVAAHELEAALINVRDPRACDSRWLGLEVGPYTVDRALADGDRIDAGPGFEVVHVPSQTPGHIALWQPEERLLVSGDLLQADDVAWVPTGGPWRDGALERTIAAVERLAALEPRVVVPGHGPPVTDVPAAVERNLARYARWRDDPEQAAWHFVRRVVVSGAVVAPVDARDPAASFAGSGWLSEVAATTGHEQAQLIEALVSGFVERGLLGRDGDRIVPRLDHEPAGPLRYGPGDPAAWPPPRAASAATAR